MFTAFWGEQQAAVAIVAAACIFLAPGGNTFDCLRRSRVASPPWKKKDVRFAVRVTIIISARS